MEAKYQETKKESKPSSGKEEINVIELLEEDDEFEEFESNWNIAEDDEEPQLWQDDWDDDNANDEFTDQLRQVINNHQNSTSTVTNS